MCVWQVEALREKEEEHAKALAALRKEHETESIRRSRTSGSFEPPQPPVVTPPVVAPPPVVTPPVVTPPPAAAPADDPIESS